METKTEGQKNKGGRPRKPVDVSKLLESPEVRALMAQAASDGAQAALLQLGASAGPVNVPTSSAAPGSADWANTLAMAIAQAADPKRKPLDPKVVEQRLTSRRAMNELIAAAKARIAKFQDAGDHESASAATPEYELTKEIYVEEQLIQATYMGADRIVRRQRIGWLKAPNQVMRPVNDIARAIYGEYLLSVGGVVTEGRMPDREAGSSLSVFQDGKLVSMPTMSKNASRNSGSALSLRGNAIPGQVVETAVLGTRAAPARQLA